MLAFLDSYEHQLNHRYCVLVSLGSFYMSTFMVYCYRPLVIFSHSGSPKTRSHNIATSNLFQAQFHFYFRFYHRGCLS